MVKDGRVLSKAHRGEKPKSHAEYIALEEKLPDDLVAGATVYTTLEPCTTRNHPKIPCAERLIERKIARVVIGMHDPDPRITGQGFKKLRSANIVIALFPNDLMAQVEELNREFSRKFDKERKAGQAPVRNPVEQVLPEDPRIYLDFDPDWGKQAEHLGLSTPILLTNRGGSDAHDVIIETIRLRATNIVFETPVPVIAGDETKKIRPMAAPTGAFRSNLIPPLNDEWESYKSLAKETVEIPVRITYKTFTGKKIETCCVLVFNGILAALNKNHGLQRNPVSFHQYRFNTMIEAEAAPGSAKAFERIADAAHGQLRAMKDRDRPRLRVEMAEPEAMPGPFPLIGNQSAIRVSLAIHNQGPTDAFNVKVRAFYITVANRAGRDHPETGWLQDAPGTVGNTKQTGPVMVSIRVMGFRNEELDGESSVDSVAISPDLLVKLKEGKRFIQASGLVTYTDIYDDPHETPFDFVWRSTGDYVSNRFWRTDSYWFERSAQRL